MHSSGVLNALRIKANSDRIELVDELLILIEIQIESVTSRKQEISKYNRLEI